MQWIKQVLYQNNVYNQPEYDGSIINKQSNKQKNLSRTFHSSRCFELWCWSICQNFAHTFVVQKQHSNSVGTSASRIFSFLCLFACSIAICLRSSATSYNPVTMFIRIKRYTKQKTKKNNCKTREREREREKNKMQLLSIVNSFNMNEFFLASIDFIQIKSSDFYIVQARGQRAEITVNICNLAQNRLSVWLHCYTVVLY